VYFFRFCFTGTFFSCTVTGHYPPRNSLLLLLAERPTVTVDLMVGKATSRPYWYSPTALLIKLKSPLPIFLFPDSFFREQHRFGCFPSMREARKK